MADVESTERFDLMRQRFVVEAYNERLIEVIANELNELEGEYERHRFSMGGCQSGLFICGALAAGFYCFGVSPADVVFAMLAGISGLGLADARSRRAYIRYRISSIQERLWHSGHMAEWSDGKIPKATVVRRKNYRSRS